MFKDYSRFYDLIYAKKPYKKEADFVYKWANKPKTILELGGGTGKHAQYWVKKARVWCVEQSKEMQTSYPGAPFIGDITTFDYSKLPKMDAIFAMFNVVGYADPICYLERLPLKKGGYFIFDCWDSSVVEEEPPEYNGRTFGDITRVVYPTIKNYFPYQRLEITIAQNNKPLFSEIHIVRSYYMDEIEALAKCCGYKIDGIKNEKGWVTWVKLKKI